VTDTVDRLDYGCAVELYGWPVRPHLAGKQFDVAIGDIVGAVDLSISANERMWPSSRTTR